MAGPSLLPLPLGMWVTRTTVSEMKPGTDRSMPRCWTTSVWPTAARMSTAAKGHSAASALPPRLFGWKIALSAKISPVATQMPADRRHRPIPKLLTAGSSLLPWVAQLVAGLGPRGGPGPAPDHLGLLVGRGVAEAVPGPLAVEDHVAGRHLDLVVAVEHDPLAAHDQRELLGAGVPVPLVLGLPGGEHGAPEHHVLGPGPGRVDEELDGHPDPALVRPEARHGRHVPDADVKRIRHVSPHRVLTLRRWTAPPPANVQHWHTRCLVRLTRPSALHKR